VICLIRKEILTNQTQGNVRMLDIDLLHRLPEKVEMRREDIDRHRLPLIKGLQENPQTKNNPGTLIL
jgi:hypothetical protein